MKIAVFSTKPYDRSFLAAETCSYDFGSFEPRLATETAKLAAGLPVVCAFVNDQLDACVLKQLADQGTKLVALRCAGFNNVDLAAQELGLRVVRVPGYSPYAVAEHTVALILALNRKIHRSHVWWRIAAVVVFQAVFTYWPVMNSLFHVAPLDA